MKITQRAWSPSQPSARYRAPALGAAHSWQGLVSAQQEGQATAPFILPESKHCCLQQSGTGTGVSLLLLDPSMGSLLLTPFPGTDVLWL